MAKQTQRAGAPNAAQRNAPLPPQTFNRTERTLTFMVAGVLGISLVAFIMLIVAWLTIGHIPSNHIWQVATALPLVGFPIGMLLVFALLVVVWTRKARENRIGTR